MLLGEYKAMSCLGESTVLWARQGLVPQGDLGFVQVVRNSPFPQHFVRLVSASWSRTPLSFFPLVSYPLCLHLIHALLWISKPKATLLDL